MPVRVSRSRTPNSFSRRRSSTTNAGLLGAEPARRLDELGRAPGAQVGRGQDDVRAARGRHRSRTSARAPRLLLAERAQGHVDVPLGDVDQREAGGVGGVARDVARALAVTDDPKALRPSLLHGSLAPGWTRATRQGSSGVSFGQRPSRNAGIGFSGRQRAGAEKLGKRRGKPSRRRRLLDRRERARDPGAGPPRRTDPV